MSIEIGKFNNLQVVKIADHGVYVDGPHRQSGRIREATAGSNDETADATVWP